MNERIPLFVKPPSFKWHLLLIFGIAGMPVYFTLVMLFTSPNLSEKMSDILGIALVSMVVATTISIFCWGIIMGRYMAKRYHSNPINITFGLEVTLLIGYFFYLFIVFNIVMNIAFTIYGQ